MTVKETEALLIATITSLKLFVLVVSLTEEDFRGSVAVPSAFVILDEDFDTGIRSRLVMSESYAVYIKQRKGVTDATKDIYALRTAVRNAIHGKAFGKPEIDAFQYTGSSLVSAEGQDVIYKLTFRVTQTLHIPMQ